MSQHEILCINKNDRFNPDQRILRIGGRNQDGSRWAISQEDAIEGIESGKWSFFVKAGQHTVDVVVAVSRFGNKYLKTESDGDTPDNLLSLPEC